MFFMVKTQEMFPSHSLHRTASSDAMTSTKKKRKKNLAYGSFLLTALLFIHYESAEGAFIERPKNAIVIVNHSTFFNCSKSSNKSNEPIWYHHPLVGVRQDVYDYNRIRDKYKDRFSIEKNMVSGAFNLLVQRPEPTDAGRYQCVEDVDEDIKASAELTVLDSNLVCESSKDLNEVVGPTECAKTIAPDQLQLSCSVSYNGNFPPPMQWRKAGNALESMGIPNCGFRGNSVMCNATLEANFNMDGSVYVCQVVTAEQYNCSLNVKKTIYTFSDTSVRAITTTEEAFCSANTSMDLPCSYKWYKENETRQLGQTLKPSNPGLYRCEAECIIRNEICAFTAMIINASEPETSKAGLIAGLVIATLTIAIISTALIIIVLWWRNKNGKQKNQPEGHLTLKETGVPLMKTGDSQSELSAELSSLPNITDQNMVDMLAINQFFIDRGASGAIYGPFRWKDKKCAFKQILFSPDALTKETEENILQKANRCKELNHPHLVKVFQMWFPSPALYIVMEYAEGGSLDKILRPKDALYPLPSFELNIVQNWALQIADGMKYLHYNDLVHRNLKAAHVLVMKSPDVLPNTLKIGSLTLIKEHDHATIMSAKGTMAWMAPECILSEPFSKLSDVWSYGVTVWEILTRDVPYKEVKKESDLARAAMNKTLKLKIPDSYTEPLKDLLTKCWNHEVDKRPSFTEICDYLRSPRIFR